MKCRRHRRYFSTSQTPNNIEKATAPYSRAPKHTENIISTPARTDEDYRYFGSKSFRDLGLNNEMLFALGDVGLRKPTMIQELAIPQLLGDHPPTIIAERTGTGKTYAYLLPLIQKLKEEGDERPDSCRPRAVIFVPSRELALQISKCIKRLTHNVKLSSSVLANVIKKKAEKTALFEGRDIIVCTPKKFIEYQELGIYLSYP